MTDTHDPDAHGIQHVRVDQGDWDAAMTEWRTAAAAALSACDSVRWPAVADHEITAWRNALEREDIAKTRLLALSELQSLKG